VIYLHHLRDPRAALALAGVAPLVRFAHAEQVVCPNDVKSFPPDWRPCTYRSGALACGILCPYVHRYGSRHPARVAAKLALQRAMDRANRGIARWVVASRFMARSLERERLRPESIHVIPYFTRLAGDPAAPPSGTPSALFIGRLVAAKGVDHLLRAFARLRLKASLSVAGDGEEAPRLKALARELGVEPRVRFLGPVDHSEVGTLIERHHLVVMPSLWQEPFGIVGIEAMARGRPVVAYRVGGIEEWLEDGKTGYLARPGDVGHLADRIDALLSAPGTVISFGSAGRARVAERYLPRPHLDALEAVFRLAISPS